MLTIDNDQMLFAAVILGCIIILYDDMEILHATWFFIVTLVLVVLGCFLYTDYPGLFILLVLLSVLSFKNTYIGRAHKYKVNMPVFVKDETQAEEIQHV